MRRKPSSNIVAIFSSLFFTVWARLITLSRCFLFCCSGLMAADWNINTSSCLSHIPTPNDASGWNENVAFLRSGTFGWKPGYRSEWFIAAASSSVGVPTVCQLSERDFCQSAGQSWGHSVSLGCRDWHRWTQLCVNLFIPTRINPLTSNCLSASLSVPRLLHPLSLSPPPPPSVIIR